MNADFQPLVDAIERSKQSFLDERTEQIASFLEERSLPHAAKRVRDEFLGRPLDHEVYDG